MTSPDPNLRWAADDVAPLAVVHEENHAEIALAQLPGIFRTKTNIRRLLMVLANGVQRVEDDAWGVYLGTRLGSSEGAALDRWGALVGEPRGALLDDTDYRCVIEARALANSCDGTVDSLIGVMKAALYPVICIEHFDLHPAGFQIQAARDAWMEEPRRARVRAILADCTPAGRLALWVEALHGGFGPPASCVGNTFTGAIARVI